MDKIWMNSAYRWALKIERNAYVHLVYEEKTIVIKEKQNCWKLTHKFHKLEISF